MNAELSVESGKNPNDMGKQPTAAAQEKRWVGRIATWLALILMIAIASNFLTTQQVLVVVGATAVLTVAAVYYRRSNSVLVAKEAADEKPGVFPWVILLPVAGVVLGFFSIRARLKAEMDVYLREEWEDKSYLLMVAAVAVLLLVVVGVIARNQALKKALQQEKRDNEAETKLLRENHRGDLERVTRSVQKEGGQQ